MAEKATIARPYARAAFEYAREHGALAAWSELLAAGAAVAATPGADDLFGNPRVSAIAVVTSTSIVFSTSARRISYCTAISDR